MIPVFHPTSKGLIAWQFIMVIIIFLYFFYIPLKVINWVYLDSLYWWIKWSKSWLL